MGIGLVQDRIKVLNDTRKKKILINVREIEGQGMYRGTAVKIEIPL
jgi:hypothetical protein